MAEAVARGEEIGRSVPEGNGEATQGGEWVEEEPAPGFGAADRGRARPIGHWETSGIACKRQTTYTLALSQMRDGAAR